jgi:endonuclease III
MHLNTSIALDIISKLLKLKAKGESIPSKPEWYMSKCGIQKKTAVLIIVVVFGYFNKPAGIPTDRHVITHSYKSNWLPDGLKNEIDDDRKDTTVPLVVQKKMHG